MAAADRDDLADREALAGVHSTKVKVGNGLTAAAYPHIVLKGDLTGDGVADAWAVAADGSLVVLPGVAGGGFGAPVTVSGAGTWSGVASLG